jgi:competence ComEA-like helix-hairpin-helix protein
LEPAAEVEPATQEEEAVKFETLFLEELEEGEGIQPATAEEAVAREELPDWLRELEAETPEMPLEEQPQVERVVEEPALAEPGAWEEEEFAEAAVSETVEEEGLPDWLKELEKIEPTPVEPSLAETPEWMLESEIQQAAEPEITEAITEEPEPAIQEPAVQEPAVQEPAVLEPAVEMPSWLMEETPAEETAVFEPEAEAVEPDVEGTPEWAAQPELEEEWDQATAEAPTQVSQREPAALEPAALEPAAMEPAAMKPTERIDINSASLRELESLPGIGFILAQSIINYRELHGPFKSIEELQEISGIGPSLVDELRDQLEAVVEAPEPSFLEERFAEVQGEEASALMAGREALVAGNFEAATGKFSELIHKNLYLEEIIRDLQEALYQQSGELTIWETLGDAYMRNEQLQEALEAYSRAEELLG